jgi:hypothetical protein
MDKVLRIIFGTVGILITLISAHIIYDISTGTKYYHKIASGQVLSSEELSFLNSQFDFQKNEHIKIIYGYGKSPSEGAVILTNIRLINFIEGEGKNEAQQFLLKDIKSVNLRNRDNFAAEDLITIVDNAGSSIVLSIVNSQNSGPKLTSRIKNSILE